MKTTRPKPPSLSIHQLTRLQQLAIEVWGEIGPDCLASQRPERAWMTRTEVVEVILDCDRLHDHITRKLGARFISPEATAELTRIRDYVDRVGRGTLVKVIGPAFGDRER